MKLTILNLTVMLLCFSLPVIDIGAQPPEAERPVSSQVKIESFDWYAERDVGDLVRLKNYYRQGLPEGRSANFPAEDSSRRKDSEKFIYRLRISNLSANEIVAVVWRYEFVNPLTGEPAASLEFESRVRIKPSQRKTIYAESFLPPVPVVDVNWLLLDKKNPFLESAAVQSVVFKEITVKNKNIKGKKN